ncbi:MULTISPECIES: aldolase/citrate lyase family protein [Enorma]|uniref:Aldolase n=1 Tax=Enorma phocaeensis TaxID=1871019 RepID=A0A921LTR5_9ACTN|nr:MULTISPECIES: aldolase/citrate lyase family protein [Enorma]HJG37651.1 aldolase [Enorma phocaeensis]
MNATGRKMLEILKELKEDCGCKAIKAEFEAEGSRTDEMIMLNEVINRADVPLTIKIGGCEAVRDLDQCKLLGAAGVMAPMIETPFALSKFKGAAQKVYGDEMGSVEWIINAETITCQQNYDAILKEGAGFLDMVGVGRVDLSSSMGLTRADINSDTMFEAVSEIAKRSREAGLRVCFGGGISFDAIPFIQKMTPLADRFETRKVHFEITDDERVLRRGILLAMKFEALYLESKCTFYDRMAGEDRERMKMMYERIAVAEGK